MLDPANYQKPYASFKTFFGTSLELYAPELGSLTRGYVEYLTRSSSEVTIWRSFDDAPASISSFCTLTSIFTIFWTKGILTYNPSLKILFFTAPNCRRMPLSPAGTVPTALKIRIRITVKVKIKPNR